MIPNTFSNVDKNSLTEVYRSFIESLPDGFLDAFIVKYPLDDEDNKEFQPEATCCGVKEGATNIHYICLINKELTDEEKRQKLDADEANELKHCYGCAK